MSFDVYSDCGGANGWTNALGLALAWAIPTVLFALYRQFPRESPWSSLLGLALLWAAAAAAIASLFEIRAIDVQVEALRLLVEGFLMSAIAILTLRRLRGCRLRLVAARRRS